jgi:hypothetical protein
MPEIIDDYAKLASIARMRGFTLRAVGKDFKGENATEILCPRGTSESSFEQLLPRIGKPSLTYLVPRWHQLTEENMELLNFMALNGQCVEVKYGLETELWECIWTRKGISYEATSRKFKDVVFEVAYLASLGVSHAS